jgi:lipid A 3-O-deacylase
MSARTSILAGGDGNSPGSCIFTFSRAWILLVALVVASLAPAREASGASFTPSMVFVQGGAGDEQTQAYVLGATWDLPWKAEFRIGSVSAYLEAAFGRWTTRAHGTSTAWPTQLSLTPVVRLHPPGAAHRWFGELGVGANYIVPVFESGDKRFSTEFNFGSHVAGGRQFGAQGQLEVSLRMQHFSNGGISRPNPGENFVQLRLAHTF